MAQCEAISNPKTAWPAMCPNLPAAYLFACLFAATTIAHFVQMILHRKLYTLVIVISGGMQTTAYVFRILSIKNVTNDGFYSDWFILMMVSPIFTNAYAYMVMGRMVYNFTPTASVFKVKAWRFGLIFVLLDILAFFVQAAGAVIASGNDKTLQQALLGIHVYMGGIGFQEFCILLFLALAVRYHLKLRQQLPSPQRATGLLLLYVLYAVVGLITVRIIFRLAEYSNGFKSTIPTHEAYQYVLDSTLMLIASVLFNIFHPGRLMPGKESNLPSRKIRKGLKKEGKVPQGRAGEEYLLPKFETASTSASGMASYEASRQHYTRLETPSPPRARSFDEQSETLHAPAASFDYSYAHDPRQNV